MTWTQNYNPLDSALLSPLAAALPVVLLLGLLATGRVSAPAAALAGLVIGNRQQRVAINCLDVTVADGGFVQCLPATDVGPAHRDGDDGDLGRMLHHRPVD